jgi:hypothetical protein
LGAGFTPVERVLIFAAPVLAAALTFNYQWRNEDAEERAAESTRRERLAGEVKNLGAQLKVLGDKLAALEKWEKDRSIGNPPAEVVAILPVGVSINEYVVRGGTATIKGIANGYDALFTFAQGVKASNYFANVTIANVTFKRASQNSGFGVEWELICTRRDPFENGSASPLVPAGVVDPAPRPSVIMDVPDRYRPPPSRYDVHDRQGVPHAGY